MPAQQLPRRQMAHTPRALAGRPANETAFEAYIRFLHENKACPDPNAEPARGRDPWAGLAL